MDEIEIREEVPDVSPKLISREAKEVELQPESSLQEPLNLKVMKDETPIKKYKCLEEGCTAEFSKPGKLQNHRILHSGIKPYDCSVEGCDKAYSSLAHLKRHHNQTHASSSPSRIVCTVAGCGRNVKTRDILIKHMKRCHNDKIHCCQICHWSFQTQSELDNHVALKHNSVARLICEKCQLEFTRVGKFNRHMRKHQLHICPHLGCFYFSDQYLDLRRHIAALHPKFLECYHCGKRVKDKAQLRRHCHFHLVKMGLADPQPGKTITPFPCQLCSRVLSTKGSLKRHIEQIHTGQRKERVYKRFPERAIRKDIGIPRKSIAERIISGTALPLGYFIKPFT